MSMKVTKHTKKWRVRVLELWHSACTFEVEADSRSEARLAIQRKIQESPDPVCEAPEYDKTIIDLIEPIE